MKKKRFTNPLIQEMYDLVHRKNRNTLIVIVGESGTGKSWLAVRLAELLDESFTTETIKDRIVFKPQDFTNIVAEGKLKKGSAVILDEAGTAVDSHTWYSHNNRAVKYIFQTFRQDNLIVIFTVPVIDYIDSAIRKQFKFYIETEDILFKHNKCRAKVRKLWYNQLRQKLWNPMPIYKTRDGKIRKFDRFYFSKADDKLIKAYQDAARPFKIELKKELNAALQMERDNQNKKEKQKMTDDEVIEKVLANKKRYIKTKQGRTFCDIGLLKYDFKMGDVRSKAIKSVIDEDMI